MELSPWKFLISATHTEFRANQSKILGINSRCCPVIASSKRSRYQDFQDYAKPLRLLPAKGVRIERDAFFRSSSCSSIYKLRLQTSNSYGSGLSDVNSGILLCLIDENGSSILQRLSATSEDYETLRFERGSVDEFTFEGPHLGRIVAVWISLESGQWRMSGINLRVIPPLGAGGRNEEMKHLSGSGLEYKFKLDDILLGEKGEASMMELRPNSVTTISEDEYESTLLNEENLLISNEESMIEYAYLKLSLLFYDTVLILAGSAVAFVSIGENAAYAFLIGGLLGFAYLLLVQRSVDELPMPELIRREEEGNDAGRRISVLIAALVFAFAVVMLRYASGVKFVANDIIIGMMGFLMCKVAVVLAAFKPIRDNE